jgi:hypothetical protein
MVGMRFEPSSTYYKKRIQAAAKWEWVLVRPQG